MPFDLKIFRTIVDAALAFLGKKIDTASQQIVAAVKHDDDGRLSNAIDGQTRSLALFTSKVTSALTDLKKIEVTSDVTVDTSKLEQSLKDLLDLCDGIKVPDIANVEASLKMIYDCIEEGNSSTNQLLAEVKQAVASLSLSVPGTFSLDQNQLRAITGSMRSLPTNPAPLAARNVRTVNITLTASNTEYTYVFPPNTTAWNLKLRDQGTLGYYAFVPGKMPAGGDSSNYITIPQNFIQSPANVDWSGKTIYLGAESNSQVAELTVFTA
jgi:hypothetical protein